MNNILISFIKNHLLRKGCSLCTANAYSYAIFNELFGKNRHKYSFGEKIFAYRHGFLAEDVKVLGIDKSNYKDFITSKDFCYLNPIDPFTKRIIDGKLIIYYTIGGRFPQYLPKYYCWINENGEVIPLEGSPIVNFKSLEDYLIKILDVVKQVAIKPLTGGGGQGFIKLEKKRGKLYVNNDIVENLSSIIPQISQTHVVTEYSSQCDDFNKICSDSVATLRVVAFNFQHQFKVAISYVRFGTKVSKSVSNMSAGGVAIPFDWETGKFDDYFYRLMEFSPNGEVQLECHPDSKISLKGKYLPHFSSVKKAVNDLGNYFAVHKYFGFDIIITNDGPKICEINSHPILDIEQLMMGGVWKRNDEVSAFFRSLLKGKNHYI